MSAADTIRAALEQAQGSYFEWKLPSYAQDMEAALGALGILEAEVERLTVGRATLEDQTNRAELAEARADVFEAALRQIAAAGYVRTGAGGFDDPASTTSDPRLEGLADIARAALVLSGGSE